MCNKADAVLCSCLQNGSSPHPYWSMGIAVLSRGHPVMRTPGSQKRRYTQLWCSVAPPNLSSDPLEPSVQNSQEMSSQLQGFLQGFRVVTAPPSVRFERGHTCRLEDTSKPQRARTPGGMKSRKGKEEVALSCSLWREPSCGHLRLQIYDS